MRYSSRLRRLEARLASGLDLRVTLYGVAGRGPEGTEDEQRRAFVAGAARPGRRVWLVPLAWRQEAET